MDTDPAQPLTIFLRHTGLRNPLMDTPMLSLYTGCHRVKCFVCSQPVPCYLATPFCCCNLSSQTVLHAFRCQDM